MARSRDAALLMRRERDGVRMFRSLPHQDQIFTNTCTEYLILGGNRGGKSISAGVKFAAIARDLPVLLSDGRTLVEQRRPWQKGRPLLMWIIGLDWKHLRTIYRILFKAGLYKIIFDPRAPGLFRPSRGVIDDDKTMRRSFPLIPEWDIKGGKAGIAFESKKTEEFCRLELNNGTIIEAYASTGEVKMGDPVDVIWIDEEIAILGHYAEWLARLSDNNGFLYWSTMPTANPALLQVYERSRNEQHLHETEPTKPIDVGHCRLSLWANPHIEEAVKKKREAAFTEDDRQMRIEGEFPLSDLKIYPSFSRTLHAAIPADETLDDPLAKILRARNGEPGDSWTREVILDPGTVKPGVLLCAIPPPYDVLDGAHYELWSDPDDIPLVVYDEVYIPRGDADTLADAINQKTTGYAIERFIIDGKAAAQTAMGYAGTIGDNYSRAFSKKGLLCRQTGSSFTYGDPSFTTAMSLVNGALKIRKCGTPRLRFVLARVPRLIWQIENNVLAFQLGPDRTKIVLDKEPSKQHNDQRRCLEYWLSRHPTYIRPPPVQRKSWGHALYDRLTKRSPSAGRGDSSFHLGPGLLTETAR